MKKYYKNEQGRTIWFDGILRIGNKQIINPKHEELIENGWIEYIPPIKSKEDILIEARYNKIEEIKSYDSSVDVNEFYINDYPVWLDKATRAGLKLRFEAEKVMQKENTTLWYNQQEFVLPLDAAIQMLFAIEVYASECYDNTQKHIAEVSKLETKEEIEMYDFRVGYPEKLRL